MTAGIVAFLRARLDEDEAAARATSPTGRRLSWRPDVTEDAAGHCVVSWPDVAGVAEAWAQERGTAADVAEHIARHDPARVLREVEAKRCIVDEHRPLTANDWPAICDTCSPNTAHWFRGGGAFVAKGTLGQSEGGALWPCPTLRLLALPYDQHADYDEGWRP